MQAEKLLASVYSSSKDATPDICIIGAGFSGICAAIQLQKQLGLKAFTIFESNEDVGGTWLVNTYPGCFSDAQSHLYSLSFENNPNIICYSFASFFASQPEILAYMQKFAKKYGIYPHVKFNTEIKTVTWDEDLKKWRASYVDKSSTNNNEENEMLFDIVINGSGALREPQIPEQFLSFEGPLFHSAKWDSSVEIDKRKVIGVIGSGASAIQIIPSIVDQVKELHAYQRKPAWVFPRIQSEVPEFVKWIFAYIPLVMWLFRVLMFFTNELFISLFRHKSVQSYYATKLANSYRSKSISNNPKLVEKLTPNYTLGCKRLIVSELYYPAMKKSHVRLHTSHVDQVTENSIITKDGNEQKIDILILATGFKVQEYFASLKIYGKYGVNILDTWKKTGMRHYKGIVCQYAPNLFFLLGPNTGLGHNTVIFQIECQVDYIVAVIKEMMQRNVKIIGVKAEAEDEYLEEIARNMKKTVWGNSQCGSWYADENGDITTLWPKTCTSYWMETKKVEMDKFQLN